MSGRVGFVLVLLSLVGCLGSPAAHHHARTHSHHRGGLISTTSHNNNNKVLTHTSVDGVLALLNEARHLEEENCFTDYVKSLLPGTAPTSFPSDIPTLTVDCGACPPDWKGHMVNLVKWLMAGFVVPNLLPRSTNLGMFEGRNVVAGLTVYAEPITSLNFHATYENLYKSASPKVEMPYHYFMLVRVSDRSNQDNPRYYRVERDDGGLRVTDMTQVTTFADNEVQTELKPLPQGAHEIASWSTNLSREGLQNDFLAIMKTFMSENYNTSENNCQHTIARMIQAFGASSLLNLSDKQSAELRIQDPSQVAQDFTALLKACQAC